jgi:alpha-ketoglutarate-dependent taurine dioxygenase
LIMKPDRKEQLLNSLLNVKAMPVTASKGTVSESRIGTGEFPIIIEPQLDGVDLAAWMKEPSSRSLIAKKLLSSGAVLFRGFEVFSMDEFQKFVSAFNDEQMLYVDQSSPRTKLINKLYTSTDHPASEIINFHCELSYSQSWPNHIMFFCKIPSETGGETPIADIRNVGRLLSTDVKRKFKEEGVLYVRNLVKGFGLAWQDVYQTTERAVVEEHCRRNGINFEWKDDDYLRISWRRPAFAVHPTTNEELWFNHAFFFNAENLSRVIHGVVTNKDDLPFNTFFGSGQAIPHNVVEELRVAYHRSKVEFTWRKGDILLLDNMLMAHARNSFTGHRSIVVAMCNPINN